MDGKGGEVVAPSRLRLKERAALLKRLRFGDDSGNADSLSELVSKEEEDSASA